MLSRSSFYVTLPSNGSRNYYNENTASTFRNHLAHPLELEGQWEVALVEMQYPITWKLLKKDNKIGLTFFHTGTHGVYKPQKRTAKFSMTSQTLFQFMKKSEMKAYDNFTKADMKKGMPDIMHSYIDKLVDKDNEVGFVSIELSEDYLFNIYIEKEAMYKSVDYVEAYLPVKFYNSPVHVARTLVQEIRDKIETMTAIFKTFNKDTVALGLDYNKDSGVIRFYTALENVLCGLVMYKTSEELHRVLGFTTSSLDVVMEQVPYQTQSTKPQMKFNTPALYVYSDIIGDELVGDAKVPLLRAVPIDGEMGDFVHKEFIRPYYKSVNKGYINSILIEVKDDTGQDMQFTIGKVICTLHFRRCGLAV